MFLVSGKFYQRQLNGIQTAAKIDSFMQSTQLSCYTLLAIVLALLNFVLARRLQAHFSLAINFISEYPSQKKQQHEYDHILDEKALGKIY